jgi:hypothetical protein
MDEYGQKLESPDSFWCEPRIPEFNQICDIVQGI